MLREVLGEVRMDKGLISEDSSIRPKAPGMKYRHYAPKADLTIVEGEPDSVIRSITDLVSKAEREGKRAGIITTDENKGLYPSGIVKTIGSRVHEETIAHNLYELLREFDSLDVQIIYSEAFHTPHMGQAIMNRLLKAAGHKVIKV